LLFLKRPPVFKEMQFGAKLPKRGSEALGISLGTFLVGGNTYRVVGDLAVPRRQLTVSLANIGSDELVAALSPLQALLLRRGP
jgi:hypothetical protein